MGGLQKRQQWLLLNRGTENKQPCSLPPQPLTRVNSFTQRMNSFEGLLCARIQKPWGLVVSETVWHRSIWPRAHSSDQMVHLVCEDHEEEKLL